MLRMIIFISFLALNPVEVGNVTDIRRYAFIPHFIYMFIDKAFKIIKSKGPLPLAV